MKPETYFYHKSKRNLISYLHSKKIRNQAQKQSSCTFSSSNIPIKDNSSTKEYKNLHKNITLKAEK